MSQDVTTDFRSIPAMWNHRVRSTPESVAMLYRRGTEWVEMTWLQADAQVQAMAAGLISLGLLGKTAALHGVTSPWWVMSDMAILSAQGVTTTIYPSSTDEESLHILRDADTAVLFCDSRDKAALAFRHREELPHLQAVIVSGSKPHGENQDFIFTVDELQEIGNTLLSTSPDAVLESVKAITADALATIVYTSGTQGEAKGVMLSHGAWLYESAAIDQLGLITPQDRQYLFLPLAHSFARVMEMAFIRMGVPTALDADNDNLFEHLQAVKPTFFASVPRLFEVAYAHFVSASLSSSRLNRHLLHWGIDLGRRVSIHSQQGQEPSLGLRLPFALAEKLIFKKINDQFGGDLRFIISGGAPLSAPLGQFFHACGVLILEGYGLTETSAATCVNRVDDFAFGTVGKPLPGTQIKISTDNEILIQGPGVTTGYHNLPEHTAQLFTEDGWLRTGDLGRLDARGNLVVTGRIKDLIITSGGKNIAPAHFERMLTEHSPFVSSVLMYGDNRPFCVALVVLCEPPTVRWANENKLTDTSTKALMSSTEVLALIQGEIDEVNAHLPSFETVKRFILIEDPFTSMSDALTHSMKIKRQAIFEQHSDTLAELYKDMKIPDFSQLLPI